MQVDAINSVNFGRKKVIDIGDAEYREISSQPVDNKEKVDQFLKKAEKIQQNIRPETVAISLATGAIAVVSGKKVIDKTATIGLAVGEAIAKAGKMIGGKVVNLFKKGAVNAMDTTKIENAFNAARKVLNEENPKITKGIGDFVKNIVSNEEKASAITKFITENLGVKNIAGIPKAALAFAIGYKAIDTSSDVVENAADNKEISKLAGDILSLASV